MLVWEALGGALAAVPFYVFAAHLVCVLLILAVRLPCGCAHWLRIWCTPAEPQANSPLPAGPLPAPHICLSSS
jgi:hypothetical protein